MNSGAWRATVHRTKSPVKVGWVERIPFLWGSKEWIPERVHPVTSPSGIYGTFGEYRQKRKWRGRTQMSKQSGAMGNCKLKFEIRPTGFKSRLSL